MKPDLATAYIELGFILNDEGCVDEAIANFRNVIELNPGLVEAHVALILLMKEKGKQLEAISLLKKVYQTNPSAVIKLSLVSRIASMGEDYAECIFED